jgi:hypothetical protein
MIRYVSTHLSEFRLFRAPSEVLLDALTNGREVILDHVSELLEVVHSILVGLASSLQVYLGNRGMNLLEQVSWAQRRNPRRTHFIQLVDGEVCVDLGWRGFLHLGIGMILNDNSV